MTPQHETTFENIVAKGVVAQNKRFLLLPRCFHHYSIIVLSFVGIIDVFKDVYCIFVVCGKGMKLPRYNLNVDSKVSPNLRL